MLNSVSFLPNLGQRLTVIFSEPKKTQQATSLTVAAAWMGVFLFFFQPGVKNSPPRPERCWGPLGGDPSVIFLRNLSWGMIAEKRVVILKQTHQNPT